MKLTIVAHRLLNHQTLVQLSLAGTHGVTASREKLLLQHAIYINSRAGLLDCFDRSKRVQSLLSPLKGLVGSVLLHAAVTPMVINSMYLPLKTSSCS